MRSSGQLVELAGQLTVRRKIFVGACCMLSETLVDEDYYRLSGGGGRVQPVVVAFVGTVVSVHSGIFVGTVLRFQWRELFMPKPCGVFVTALSFSAGHWIGLGIRVHVAYSLFSEIPLPSVGILAYVLRLFVLSQQLLFSSTVGGEFRVQQPPSDFVILANVLVALHRPTVMAFILINDVDC